MSPASFIKSIPRKYLAAGTIVLIAAAAVGYYELSSFESTDDAFIDGHIAPVSAQVEGRITEILVKDNQLVKKGDVLARIEDNDYTYKRDMAQADALSAQANLVEAQKDQVRYETLLASEEISKQEYDHTSLKVKDSLAEAMTAKAKLDLAQLNLDRTTIVAPIDGRVSARSVEIGGYVQVGQPLLSIVSPDVWVTANFKETQLKKMRPGNPVAIQVDAYPGVTFHGIVDSLQAGTGGVFSILPAQNSTGNFIKVVQRVPVKIIITQFDNHYPLWPGLSVTPRVDLRTSKG